MNPTKPRISVVLDSQDLKAKLEAEAQKQGRSVNNLINRLLTQALSLSKEQK